MTRSLITTALFACSLAGVAQTPVSIHIDAAHPQGPYTPAWNFFGADEPNYTYAPNGTKLLRELAAIDPGTPVYFRPHNLLTSGDGSASLKWGSTGVYTENPDGSPHYDWALTDRLFDNLKATNVRPLVEIGFMPEALSPHPTPYRHSFTKAGDDVFTGWSYPPNDFSKWRALIVAYATHLHERYGSAVDTWKWEVWNEPDIAYFHGSVDEYLKLYDITTGAIRQVLPHAIVGGPSVTGGGDNKHFLKLFLEHCARGTNADSHKSGAPLDFISFHPKGSPKFIAAVGDTPAHVRMSLSRQLASTDRGFETVASFPEFRRTPIILTETDPEGCAACTSPQNGYRNGPLYGVSVAEMLARSAELARLRGVNLEAGVTWAFEFEGQPWFAGFRDLASNGIDKPVLNVFRMFARLSGSLLPLTSSAAVPVADIVASSVTTQLDISGIATRSAHSIDIILWNYHDEDLPTSDAQVALEISGLPAGRIHMTRFLMDASHSNAYAVWLQQGSPQRPTPTQVAALQTASGLESVEDRPLGVRSTVTLMLARQAVTLVHLSF